ncbi:MAG: orotidine-5'-phosphate decarboxylase [Legionella sp.]|nr:orotidine-5'-phosphate decarboxylase [Legionella sp.]
MDPNLIVALDFNSEKPALTLVDSIDPATCALKVGSELFTLLGSNFVRVLTRKGFKVFLDLKFHDIPNTVAKACKVCADLGVWMLNVHASGGYDMMTAAMKALESYHNEAPLLIAVTILTSFKETDLAAIGMHQKLIEEVLILAKLAQTANLDGVVCSAQEARLIKEHCGHSFITVTPGIRIVQGDKHDQQRIMTPSEAISQGSDFLVMGRAITHSNNPLKIINEILRSIQVR